MERAAFANTNFKAKRGGLNVAGAKAKITAKGRGVPVKNSNTKKFSALTGA